MTRIAWLLNLDADDELRNRSAYVRSPRMSARLQRFAPHAGALAKPGDVIVDADAAQPGSAAGFLGQAWCPTSQALATLRHVGATLPPTPPMQVLRLVNSRAFCAALGQELDGARFVTHLDELEAYLEHIASDPAASQRAWVAKRAFGFAARGQRRLRVPLRDEKARRWLAAALEAGDGVQIEPWVERLGDFGVHGWLEPDGTTHRGAPTVQTLNARGAWEESHLALHGELDNAESEALQGAARRAARALHLAGYFGPFGVDAYRWRDAAGAARFNPCCEINARYSMGWPVGMQGFQPRFPR